MDTLLIIIAFILMALFCWLVAESIVRFEEQTFEELGESKPISGDWLAPCIDWATDKDWIATPTPNVFKKVK